MSKLISPKELHEAACKMQLGGKKPDTPGEWELCVNFWAFNIAKGLRVPATLLMAQLMECPLSEEDVRAIAEFQEKEE